MITSALAWTALTLVSWGLLLYPPSKMRSNEVRVSVSTGHRQAEVAE